MPPQTREQLIQYLVDYMASQANNPSWFYTTSPAELETLYKDYVKSQYATDTVTPIYRAMGDSPVAREMFKLFQKIDSGERNSDGIIQEFENSGNPLTEEQKADLKTFEAERKAIDEAQVEKYVNAEIYGLPSPDPSGWLPDKTMLAGLEPVQKGGMTELATSQRWALDAQKKYADAVAALKNLETQPAVVQPTSQPTSQPLAPVVSGRQPDGSFIRPNARVIGEKPKGRVGGEKPQGRVSGSRKTEPTPVDDRQKKAIMDRNTAYVAKQAAAKRVAQDASFTERLANEIANQMVKKYGTPYDAAITTARRLAEEEAAKKYG